MVGESLKLKSQTSVKVEFQTELHNKKYLVNSLPEKELSVYSLNSWEKTHYSILWMIGNSANLSSHVRVEVKPSHKQVHVFNIILPKSNNGKPKFWMGLSKKIFWFKNCLDQKLICLNDSIWEKSRLKKNFDSKPLLGQKNLCQRKFGPWKNFRV